MIAPLRRRHRLMTTLLMVAVPLLYVVALSGRQAEPVTGELPDVFTEALPGIGEVTNEGLSFDGVPVMARVRRSGESWMIDLEPGEALAKPELLAYWTESQAAADRLPDSAYLLGAFGGSRAQSFAVPGAVLGRAGQLMLYSLGHQEVLGSVSIPAIGTPSVEETPPPSPTSEVADEGLIISEAGGS